MKIAIVGGGVVGLSSALWLRSYGHQVVVYESARVGHGASGAAAGILGAQAESMIPHPQFANFLRARALWAAFAACTGNAAEIFGYRADGVLRLAPGSHDAPDLAQASRWQESMGQRAQYLNEGALRERFPYVGEGFQQGLWLPGDAQVEPRLVLHHWLQRARSVGVEVQEHTVLAGLSELVARHDRVLIAAGLASSALVPALGLIPVRGQLLEKSMQPACFAPVLMHEHTYAVSRGDGRVVVGATVEVGRDDIVVDDASVETLQHAAHIMWPALASAESTRHWVGIRPHLASGPRVFQCAPNVWAAAGHSRHGILLALRSGEQVAQQMLLGNESALQVAPEEAINLLQKRLKHG